MPPMPPMASDITIYCAGSLRIALNEAVGHRARLVPGPSGELRSRIEKGERPEIFISADMEHPRALQASGAYGPVELFAANGFCLILGPGVSADGRSVLELLLDPELSLGTSTPKADPGGDYAWKLFDLADRMITGAKKTLREKAQTLVGGPGQKFDKSGAHPVAELLRDRRCDMFLGYHTTAIQVTNQLEGASSLELPPGFELQAKYGMTRLAHAGEDIRRLWEYLLSDPVRSIMAKHGFQAGSGPQ